MATVVLKRIEAYESSPDCTPRPDESATVFVEVSIDGLPKMELPLYVSPLTTMDEALAKAQERLAAIGQEIVDAAKTPFLPLPRKRGMFDGFED